MAHAYDEIQLPQPFARWFRDRGWQPRDHQMAVLHRVEAGNNVLLIAPTGGGKTLAGFLPSLIDLALSPTGRGIHTLYVSPLKALAVDIARNLEKPVMEMGLNIAIETRTGDTPAHKRRRQRSAPPDILITTPEQLALMIADSHAAHLFRHLRLLVLDELHALVASKRGALLSLGLARLARLAPEARRIGLSATIARPDVLQAWMVPQTSPDRLSRAELVTGRAGAMPELTILKSVERVPWSGHSARYSIGEIYDTIKTARLALIFVNTRSQAEVIFQELWRVNDDTLPIALHHGSLDVAQRRKVEAAMAEGRLKAVVSTSTLDLGVDWGNVDLVVNIGAPKGSSRLIQRIGRSNHRLDEPSRAMLVPSNRFEVLECEAARMAVKEGVQDSERMTLKKLDVLAQHILGTAVHAPFYPADLYEEIRESFAYRNVTRKEFDETVEFVATGGYALKTYERYAKLKLLSDGRLRLAHPRFAQSYRLNVGTIVEDEMLKVRLVKPRRVDGRFLPAFGGRLLGEVEEWFINSLSIGDTFIFAGEIVRLEAVEELTAFVSRTKSSEPAIPSYYGGKFPLSTYLARRVREMLAEPGKQLQLPTQVREWLSLQRYASVLPRADEMLVETFPRGNKHYLVCYPFEGRLAHQTLGMLLTRRLERLGAQPLGFVASEYALGIWAVRDFNLLISSGCLSLADLFDQDMLGDDLDAWLAESMLMKRTFRTCAIIAGLIERRSTTKEKTGRQMTVSSDLIFDVLRSHQPDHILLRAAWDDAAEGLIDARRLSELLARIKGKIIHRALDRISPLSVPVMLEIGREPVYGEANDALLEEAARILIGEAGGSA
jgi:ATP-dependent helicase Lhr and Lhr-like helicase